jgi:hypothetical protein
MLSTNRRTASNFHLEGSHSWDTWLQEGGTGLDNEFVIAGEPFPWTVFGYAPQMNQLTTPATGGIKGVITGASVYVGPGTGLPYYGAQWAGLNGAKLTGPIQDAWVALSDLQNGDTAVCVAPADPTSGYDYNVLTYYFLTLWDYKQEHILIDVVTVADGSMVDLAHLHHRLAHLGRRPPRDLNSNGRRTRATWHQRLRGGAERPR